MGGDYYDYIPFGDGRLGIVCGDVMGKGLAAALIMAMARSLLHSAVAPGRRPGEVLAEVNDGLARDLEGQRLPYFLTLALIVYDPAERRVAIAGGGHNPVLLCGRDGVREVPSRGAALGVRTGLAVPGGRHRSGTRRYGWRCTRTGSPRRARRTASSTASTGSETPWSAPPPSRRTRRLRSCGRMSIASGAGLPRRDDATLLLARLS